MTLDPPWSLITKLLALREPNDAQPYFAPDVATSFWKRGSLPATAGKLRLRLGNLDKFKAARSPVFGIAGLSVTAQTLDRAGATQE